MRMWTRRRMMVELVGFFSRHEDISHPIVYWVRKWIFWFRRPGGRGRLYIDTRHMSRHGFVSAEPGWVPRPIVCSDRRIGGMPISICNRYARRCRREGSGKG